MGYDLAVTRNAVMRWEDFRLWLEAIWRPSPAERTSKAGCKPRDAVVIFKALVLCALQNLSEEWLDSHLCD